MDAYARDLGDSIVLANRAIELEFRKRDGAWLALRETGSSIRIIGQTESSVPVRLTVGGYTVFPRGRSGRDAFFAETSVVGARSEYVEHHVTEESNGLTLELVTQEDSWQIATSYHLHSTDASVTRRFRLSHGGTAPVVLRCVDLQVPNLCLGPADTCRFQAPDQNVVPDIALASLPEGYLDDFGQRSMPDGAAGVLGVEHPPSGSVILVWAHSEEEPFQFTVARAGDRITFVQRWWVADRFTEGHVIEFGEQHLRLSHDGWASALEWFQEWYRTTRWVVPENIPDWVRNFKSYEVHVGPKRFAQGVTYQPFRRVSVITARLPEIRDLGFNVLQLMPRCPFPSYSVHDYHDIDTQYGDRDEVVDLVQRAHRLGMRILLDVVIHGVFDKTLVHVQNAWSRTLAGYGHDINPYLLNHPEWFAKDEYGQFALASTYAFNYGHPGWQRFIVEVLKHYVRELDVDGFRVDAPTWNTFPNWDPDWTAHHRASQGRLAVIQLYEQAERELKALKPDCIIYSEGVGPIWARASDCCYNYDEQWIFSALVPVVSPRGFAWRFTGTARRQVTARELSRWLEDRRRVYPDGTIKIHHVDSHDTHEWGGLGQFRREAFAIPATRALFALCAFIDGGIQNFVGAEEGSEDFYRHVIHRRDTIPALNGGGCDYTAVQVSDDMVFAPLRETNGSIAIPVINLKSSPVEVCLTIPCRGNPWPLSRDPFVVDAFNDDRFAVTVTKDRLRVTVPLDAFGVRLLIIDDPDEL